MMSINIKLLNFIQNIFGNASSSPQFILNNFTKDKKNLFILKITFKIYQYIMTFSFGEGNIKKIIYFL